MQAITSEILLCGAAEIECSIPDKEAAMVLVPHPDTICREFALQEHVAIVENWNHIGDEWVTFARRVDEFKKNKLFRHIQDPATGQLFSRFDSWAKYALGQSRSTIFSNLRVLHQLSGIVSDTNLNRMTRQNANQLVQQKKKHEVIDAVVIEDAILLTAAEFEACHAAPDKADGDKMSSALHELGPFAVSEKTVALFNQAISLAKRNCEGMDSDQEDAAIAMIAWAYLSSHDLRATSLLPQENGEGMASSPVSLM
ncbi:MAG: hypothetical protein ACLQLC_17120 [Candidatus Sulfotelmatobacter sp.]